MLALLSALFLAHLTTASKGLFMSAAAGNASDSALEAYLQSVKLACHATPWNLSSSPEHITSVAIQAVGDVHGKLYTSALDRLIPALGCVPRLYIGTSIPRGSDLYCADVVNNASFTQGAIEASAAAARAFVERYPAAQPFDWYISPEQFLNHLAEGCSPKPQQHHHRNHHRQHISATELAAAWGKFLEAWTAALAAVRPGTRVLWSPAAPESPIASSGRSAYATALADSLRTIASSAPLLTDLAIQDSVGKASNASTPGHIEYAVGCLDAAWHANISKAAFAALPTLNVSTTVNMELFLRKGRRSPPSAIIDLPAEPYEARRREICYADNGLELGPSWEARFWLQDLTELWVQ
jgi:hypothetical protein